MNKQYGGNQTYQNQTYEKSPSVSQYSTSPAVTQSYNAQQYVNQTNAYTNSSYQPVTNNYGTSQPEPPPTQQPTRTKTQRARVPPPSKVSIHLINNTLKTC